MSSYATAGRQWNIYCRPLTGVTVRLLSELSRYFVTSSVWEHSGLRCDKSNCLVIPPVKLSVIGSRAFAVVAEYTVKWLRCGKSTFRRTLLITANLSGNYLLALLNCSGLPFRTLYFLWVFDVGSLHVHSGVACVGLLSRLVHASTYSHVVTVKTVAVVVQCGAAI